MKSRLVLKRIATHVLFWTLILYWRANGDFFWGIPLNTFVLHNLIRLPIMIVATYILIYFILPKYFFEKKNYWKLGGLFLLNYFIANYIDHLVISSEFMANMLNLDHQKLSRILKIPHPFRNSFFLFSIMGLASVIRFFKLYLEKEKKERQLQEEHLSTKLAFLKTQVNPHFLFNALNNIYSMAIQKEEPEIAASLDNLAGIMQYLTYESNSKYVSLEKEIELLQNYIDIHHLRIGETDDTTISFNLEGNPTDKTIAPVILLPLVENAFKHGVKPDEKCLVSIKITILKTSLKLHISNTYFKKSNLEVKNKGIGLENVKKRLDLVYSDSHQLKLTQNETHFYTDLELELDHLENKQ